MLKDLRYAFRMLLQSKAWTAVVLLSLALGIGGTTTLFSAVNALLLRTIPAQQPHELVRLRWTGQNQLITGSSDYGYTRRPPSGEPLRPTFSYRIYEALSENNETLTDLSACAPMGRVNVVVNGHAELASAFTASGTYFPVLGIPARIGRTILPEDDLPGASPVAVISHGFWVRRFGTDPGVVGMKVLVNTTPFTIVGVLPPEYNGVQRLGGSAADIHVPLHLHPRISGSDRLHQATSWWLQMVGRLKPGVSVDQVKGNLDGPFQQAALAGWDAYTAGLSDDQRGEPGNQVRRAVPVLDIASAARGIYDTHDDTTRTLTILSFVVAIILLIVCANVANLLLSRASLRQKEITVRLSLGATRARLVRQLLTESLLLSGAGALLGLLMAYWCRQLLPQGQNAPLDAQVFAFTAGAGLLTGLLFGLVPSLRATRVDLAGSVKESRTMSRPRTLLGKSLVIVQVAMSVVLLIGAGLFLRTLHNLRSIDVGFNPENLLLVSVDADVKEYDGPQALRLFEELQEAFEAIPGVRSVSHSGDALLSGNTWVNSICPEEGNCEGLTAHMMTVSPGFFETMQIPVLAGRAFSPRDDGKAPPVALVNRTAARELFGAEYPVGRRFGFSSRNRGQFEVVGIAGDTKYSSLREAAPATVFLSSLQETRAYVTFELRTAMAAPLVAPAVREAVRRVDPDLPLGNVSTQAEAVDERVAEERLFARAFSLFGSLALLLAGIGLFGLMSYSVVRRTNEIGIRMALGAGSRRVVAMVMGESMLLVLIGCVLGLAGALAAGRFVAALLYDLAPTDPLSIAAAMLAMAAVAALAAYLPARRASRVDPIRALRYE